MELLNRPGLLFLALMLSVVSSWLVWRGFREKNVPDLLMGIGIGIPTFDIMSVHVWLAGIGVVGLGIWLRGKMESL